MKKKSLLIKFRAYLFALMLAGGISAALGYSYHAPQVTTWGIAIALFGVCMAVVLNTIDETSTNYDDN